MTLALMVAGLALVWVAITGNFSALNLSLGAAIGMAIGLLLRDRLAARQNPQRTRRIISLALLFLRELMVSAFRVAVIVLRPNLKSSLRPAIVAFPLTAKSDAEITLLANLITLTPGTLSVDVSDDRSVLYVHVLDLESREQLIAEIALGFERKVMEVFA